LKSRFSSRIVAHEEASGWFLFRLFGDKQQSSTPCAQHQRSAPVLRSLRSGTSVQEKEEPLMAFGTIEGVVIHPLTRHADDRGFFEEILRVDAAFFQEGFGQLSHSKMYPGVVKAWHIHKTQIDWWYVAFGRLRVALHDLRDGSPTRGVTQEVQLGDDLPPAH
jgi:hypothetical protein